MNEQTIIEKVKNKIRNVNDFPKKGILFRDITTAIKDPETLEIMVDWFVDKFKNQKIDYVAGLESRGFIFAVPVAYKLKAGFIPLRKAGKLPAQTVKAAYELEYGVDNIEIHQDAIKKGDRVLIVDDLLATGGTAAAACELIKKVGGDIVSAVFLLELEDLNGRNKLPKDVDIVSLVKY